MSRGKSINVFLIDGEITGRVKCTLQNWTGIAYKIPRTMLDKCKSGTEDIVEHLKQTGVYFLLGEDDNGQKFIYVGQAVIRANGDALLGRLLEHNKSTTEPYRDYWNEVIAVTTQNNSFGPTEISYLENKFYNLAVTANRYVVNNGNNPNSGNVTEEKESELEEFVDYARIVIGVLGHKAFEPIIAQQNTSNNQASDTPRVDFEYQGKFQAKGTMTNEGFVLLKGSKISNNVKASADYITKYRMENKNKLDSNFVLIDDILFTSSSAAATFVAGSAASGNVKWKTQDGKSPKDFS